MKTRLRHRLISFIVIITFLCQDMALAKGQGLLNPDSKVQQIARLLPPDLKDAWDRFLEDPNRLTTEELRRLEEFLMTNPDLPEVVEYMFNMLLVEKVFARKLSLYQEPGLIVGFLGRHRWLRKMLSISGISIFKEGLAQLERNESALREIEGYINLLYRNSNQSVWEQVDSIIRGYKGTLRERLEDISFNEKVKSFIHFYESQVETLPEYPKSGMGHRTIKGCFVSSDIESAAGALRHIGLRHGMRIVDLGCGDGRIVLLAGLLFGADATGYEGDPRMYNICCKAKGLASKRFGVNLENVNFKEEDFSEVDLSHYDAVYYFVSSTYKFSDALVIKKLKGLKPGAKAVIFGASIFSCDDEDGILDSFVYEEIDTLIGVYTKKTGQDVRSHRFRKDLREALEEALLSNGFSPERVSQIINRGLSWNDGKDIFLENDDVFSVAAMVLNRVLRKKKDEQVTAEQVKAVAEYHEFLHIVLRKNRGIINKVNNALKGRYRERLFRYYCNQYGIYKTDERLIEELITNYYTEKMLINSLELLDDNGELITIEKIDSRIPEIIESHAGELIAGIDVKRLRFGTILQDLSEARRKKKMRVESKEEVVKGTERVEPPVEPPVEAPRVETLRGDELDKWRYIDVAKLVKGMKVRIKGMEEKGTGEIIGFKTQKEENDIVLIQFERDNVPTSFLRSYLAGRVMVLTEEEPSRSILEWIIGQGWDMGRFFSEARKETGWREDVSDYEIIVNLELVEPVKAEIEKRLKENNGDIDTTAISFGLERARLDELMIRLGMGLVKRLDNLTERIRQGDTLEDLKGLSMSLKEVWQIVLAYNDVIEEEKSSWAKKMQLWEERNYWRRKIWDIFKDRNKNNKRLEWREAASEIGVDYKDLRRMCYDYLLEIYKGDLSAVEMDAASNFQRLGVQPNIKYRITKSGLLFKWHLTRAISKVEKGKELDDEERFAIIYEFLMGNYQTDPTFPPFFYNANVMTKTKRTSAYYVPFFNMKSGDKIYDFRMVDEIGHMFGKGAAVRVEGIFDENNYGWIYKVEGGGKIVCFIINKERGKMDLIDLVQQSIVDSVKSKTNAFGNPTRPLRPPSGELDTEYGRRLIREMVRHNKFTDKDLSVYPFLIPASVFYIDGGRKRGMLDFGRIKEYRYWVRVMGRRLKYKRDYRIEFYFSKRLNCWVCFAYKVLEEGKILDKPTIAFTGIEKDGKTRLYQLEKDELELCIKETGEEIEGVPEEKIDKGHPLYLWVLVKTIRGTNGRILWARIAKELGMEKEDAIKRVIIYLAKKCEGDIEKMAVIMEMEKTSLVIFLYKYRLKELVDAIGACYKYLKSAEESLKLMEEANSTLGDKELDKVEKELRIISDNYSIIEKAEKEVSLLEEKYHEFKDELQKLRTYLERAKEIMGPIRTKFDEVEDKVKRLRDEALEEAKRAGEIKDLEVLLELRKKLDEKLEVIRETWWAEIKEFSDYPYLGEFVKRINRYMEEVVREIDRLWFLELEIKDVLAKLKGQEGRAKKILKEALQRIAEAEGKKDSGSLSELITFVQSKISEIEYILKSMREIGIYEGSQEYIERVEGYKKELETKLARLIEAKKRLAEPAPKKPSPKKIIIHEGDIWVARIGGKLLLWAVRKVDLENNEVIFHCKKGGTVRVSIDDLLGVLIREISCGGERRVEQKPGTAKKEEEGLRRDKEMPKEKPDEAKEAGKVAPSGEQVEITKIRNRFGEFGVGDSVYMERFSDLGVGKIVLIDLRRDKIIINFPEEGERIFSLSYVLNELLKPKEGSLRSFILPVLPASTLGLLGFVGILTWQNNPHIVYIREIWEYSKIWLRNLLYGKEFSPKQKQILRERPAAILKILRPDIPDEEVVKIADTVYKSFDRLSIINLLKDKRVHSISLKVSITIAILILLFTLSPIEAIMCFIFLFTVFLLIKVIYDKIDLVGLIMPVGKGKILIDPYLDFAAFKSVVDHELVHFYKWGGYIREDFLIADALEVYLNTDFNAIKPSEFNTDTEENILKGIEIMRDIKDPEKIMEEVMRYIMEEYKIPLQVRLSKCILEYFEEEIGEILAGMAWEIEEQTGRQEDAIRFLRLFANGVDKEREEELACSGKNEEKKKGKSILEDWVKKIYPQLVEEIKNLYPDWKPIAQDVLYEILTKGKLPSDWPSLVSAMRRDGIIDEDDFRVITEIGRVVEKDTDLGIEAKELLTKAICIDYLIQKADLDSGFKARLKERLKSIGYISKVDLIIMFLRGLKRKLKRGGGVFNNRSEYDFVKKLERLLGMGEEIFAELGVENTNLRESDIMGNKDNSLFRHWADIFELNQMQWKILEGVKDKQPKGVIVQHIKDVRSGIKNWEEGLKRNGIDMNEVTMVYIIDGKRPEGYRIPANVVFVKSIEEAKERFKGQSIVYLAKEDDLKELKDEDIKLVERGNAGPVIELSLCLWLLEGKTYKSFLDRLAELGFIKREEIGDVEESNYIKLPNIKDAKEMWEELEDGVSYLDVWA